MKISELPERLRRLILSLLSIHNHPAAREFRKRNDEYFLNKNQTQKQKSQIAGGRYENRDSKTH